MKAASPTANEADAGPPLTAIFRMMPAGFADEVVDSALRFRNKASQQARDALNAAIDAEGFALRGFRRASKAPPHQLGIHVVQAIDEGSRPLASAVLRVWEESEPVLSEWAVERLSENGHETVGADYRRGILHRTWEEAAWTSQLEAMKAAGSPFGENEITLMLILASGKSLAVLEDPYAAIEAPRLKRWIAELNALPIDAPEWQSAAPFATAVMLLAEERHDEIVNLGLDYMEDKIEEVRRLYEDELRYLEIDLSGWFEAVSNGLDRFEKAEALILDLKERFASYQPIRPQGLSREEERARSQARGEHETAILGIVAKWEEVMAPVAEAAEEEAAEEETDPPIPTLAAKADGEALVAQRSALTEADGKIQQLEAEVARLGQAMAGVDQDKAQLGEEISELKRQLRERSEDAEQWRQAYIEEKQRSEAQPGLCIPVASVPEAIERAQKSFPDELIFALNSKSRRTTPFQRPEEVFEALAWLATEFRRLRLQPEGGGRDFDHSIKERCSGWFYAANQSEKTKGQYPEWYEASTAGKVYDLSSHIGTGTGRDPQNIIRIAFGWDEEQRRAVVGFIGPHQRNSQS